MRRVLAILCLLAALCAAPLAEAQPLKLRIGWAITPAQMHAVIFNPDFVKTGVLKHYGKSYTVELTLFRGSTPQITALAAGELDIAALAFSSFGLAIQNAHMSDIRAIGDLYQDGVPGYYTSEFVVKADGPIKSVADLKGKVIASNGLGGAIDVAMRKMLRDKGLEDKRDYQIVEVQFPAMPAMLNEGKIVLAGMVAPFSIEEKKAGHVRTLFTLADSMGVAQTTLLAARTPFIEKNRATLVDFFEDFQTGTRWFLDPKNRDKALAIIAAVTKQPASSFADWVLTGQDYFHDPDVRANDKALQANLDVQKQVGFLNVAIDVSKYADNSLVDEAAKRPR
jgi:NitT/TauT family transport system substrate-binding protein